MNQKRQNNFTPGPHDNEVEEFNCGCSVFFNAANDVVNIQYCPKHAAAPAMYEVLKTALLGYRNLVEFGHLPKSDADTQMMISTLNAALELAKGGSDETKLPISDTPEDDPFYEWPEEH